MTNIFSHSSLSNDPGKTGSSFLFYGAILFPHVGMFSLSHRECLTLQKGGVGNKMYLNSILIYVIFVSKDFDRWQKLKTITKKSLQFHIFLMWEIFLFYLDSIWTRFFYKKVGWITKGAATYMMLCEVFVSIVLTIVKLAPLCIPTSLRTADVFPVVASGSLPFSEVTVVSKLITI